MNELLTKLAECIEFGKINLASPYPPQMKGQEGADEITRRALDEGINPQDVLSKGLMPGMERVGIKFRENKVFVPEVLMAANKKERSLLEQSWAIFMISGRTWLV